MFRLGSKIPYNIFLSLLNMVYVLERVEGTETEKFLLIPSILLNKSRVLQKIHKKSLLESSS